MNSEKKHPIKVVAKKTGLSAHVIRAWEKRYSFLEPERTDTNRRLYSDRDIEHLRMLARATKTGYSIGTIAHLETGELRKMLEPASASEDYNDRERSENRDASEEHMLRCLTAIQKLDARQFENELMRASIELSQPHLLENLVIPLLNLIGELWREGRLRIIHEHFATAVLKPFLFNLRRQHTPPENASVIVIATPMGQHHELGALIISVVAAAQGWQVTYLGTNLPAEEIAAAAGEKKARTVSISLVYPQNDPHVVEQLQKLGDMLPENVRLMAGGRAAVSYSDVLDRIGAVLITDLSMLRTRLDHME